MNIPRDNNDSINSPLHQLEIQMSNARRADRNPNNSRYNTNANLNNIDRESIYSFDSVSTNGRLLDRLGLDNDDFYEDDDINFGLSQRDSVISIQSTGRLLDRLGIDDDDPALAGVNVSTDERKSRSAAVNQDRHRPIFANSANNAERVPLNMKNFANQRSLAGQNSYRTSGEKNVNRPKLKTSPVKIVLPNQNSSVDSLHADLTSINSSPSSNNNSDYQNFHSSKPFPNDIHLFTRNSPMEKNVSVEPFAKGQSGLEPGFFPKSKSVSYKQNPVQKGFSYRDKVDVTDDADDESNFSSSDSVDKISISKKGKDGTRTIPKTPSSINRSVSTSSAMGKSQVNTPPPNRIASDSSTPPTPLLAGELSPNSRTQSAIKLRQMGKDREASYQLRIAASMPYNFPKAMYLYGMALKFGQGVKQNNRHSLKWFCRCILTGTQITNPQIASRLSDLEAEDMISLINNELKNDKPIDPNELYGYYSKLQSSQLTKIINTSKSQLDIVSASYHEVGNALFSGLGLSTKDEAIGIAYLCKAGSMGFIDSMIQLGDIWCSKSKSHKKDYYKAAAWLRLSEMFGVTSIGNSWIYKEKYMPSKNKK
ncbi:uncharacterized protein AC631_04799 [Debaryomyces fabryi]|uniref:Protein DSF2 n=1 Tax=Debaryomyces fabryi TaxID=58627 RepID=A0A0V1PT65_9ASCO|nr:uncharacterized protein AC631_04799 [Debaryomyces fabryi]KRZ99432.1 hypothetical protein AC631_04799 [Debaryomyces fabryi]CUM46599.1 unnamed protein product [Debaryomyces fabryi]